MKKYLPLLFLLSLTGCPLFKPDPQPGPDPTPIVTGTPVEAPAGWIYGVTVDDTSDVQAIISAFSNLPVKPWIRVIFDEKTNPPQYADSIKALKDAGFPLMGELLDSFFMPKCSVSCFKARAEAFMNAYGSSITLWEIGNEMGGDWLGSDVPAKILASYTAAKERGLKTALTGYYCTPDNYTMVDWLKQNVPAEMRAGLDYVFISHYEHDCNGVVDTATWQAVFDRLGVDFQNAKLGFGETGIGTTNNKELGNNAEKSAYLVRYYTMPIKHDRYVGGHFWWFGLQDMVEGNRPLLPVFKSIMK